MNAFTQLDLKQTQKFSEIENFKMPGIIAVMSSITIFIVPDVIARSSGHDIKVIRSRNAEYGVLAGLEDTRQLLYHSIVERNYDNTIYFNVTIVYSVFILSAKLFYVIFLVNTSNILSL